jgi:hypothetical protein
VGTFVDLTTCRNVYVVVILTGKDTNIVGNLQVVFDSLFIPFKDKPTTNPRLETLYRVLGRVNNRLKANICNNGTVQVFPVFNPLCTEKARKLKLLPIPTVMKHINTVEDDSDEQILEQLG